MISQKIINIFLYNPFTISRYHDIINYKIKKGDVNNEKL